VALKAKRVRDGKCENRLKRCSGIMGCSVSGEGQHKKVRGTPGDLRRDLRGGGMQRVGKVCLGGLQLHEDVSIKDSVLCKVVKT